MALVIHIDLLLFAILLNIFLLYNLIEYLIIKKCGFFILFELITSKLEES